MRKLLFVYHLPFLVSVSHFILSYGADVYIHSLYWLQPLNHGDHVTGDVSRVAYAEREARLLALLQESREEVRNITEEVRLDRWTNR